MGDVCYNDAKEILHSEDNDTKGIEDVYIVAYGVVYTWDSV